MGFDPFLGGLRTIPLIIFVGGLVATNATGRYIGLTGYSLTFAGGHYLGTRPGPAIALTFMGGLFGFGGGALHVGIYRLFH